MEIVEYIGDDFMFAQCARGMGGGGHLIIVGRTGKLRVVVILRVNNVEYYCNKETSGPVVKREKRGGRVSRELLYG